MYWGPRLKFPGSPQNSMDRIPQIPAVQNPAKINDTVGDPFTRDFSPRERSEGGRQGRAGIREEEGEGNMRERKFGETQIISLTLDVAFFSMGRCITLGAKI